MSQQKWNHSVTGAKKLVHLYVSFCVNRPSARIICHQGLQPELKLRQKGLQICRRCFKCCHFTKRGRFNASQGESWVRGGKLSKGPWLCKDMMHWSWALLDESTIPTAYYSVCYWIFIPVYMHVYDLRARFLRVPGTNQRARQHYMGCTILPPQFMAIFTHCLHLWPYIDITQNRCEHRCAKSQFTWLWEMGSRAHESHVSPQQSRNTLPKTNWVFQVLELRDYVACGWF